MLTNYKFDHRTYNNTNNSEENEENSQKGFQPIENINILKEKFDISGIFFKNDFFSSEEGEESEENSEA